MFKALAAVGVALLATAGPSLAQSTYGQSTYGQSTYGQSTYGQSSFNAPPKQETYVYCIASDGHYTLYSGVFTLRGRQLSEVNFAWQNYVKTAKPRLDFGDGPATGASACSVVLAATLFEATNAEAMSASAVQRTTHSVRSFGTAWAY